MTVIPTLTTERLTLRAPRPEDFDPYAAILASPRARFMGLPSDRDGAWKTFSAEVAGWVLYGAGYWSMTDRDGRYLGSLGIWRPDRYPDFEIGWMIGEAWEGRGYATEAGRAALDWARGRFAALVSYIDPENARSIAVATRLGATRDPAAPLPRGETVDGTHVYRHWGPA